MQASWHIHHRLLRPCCGWIPYRCWHFQPTRWLRSHVHTCPWYVAEHLSLLGPHLIICVTGIYPISTLAVTWAAGTLAPDDKRAIGMPLASSIGNLSNFVSSQLYPTQQGPRYIQGNAVSAGLTVVAALLYSSCWLLLRTRNNKKEKLISEGATTNGLEGDRGLDHKYLL